MKIDAYRSTDKILYMYLVSNPYFYESNNFNCEANSIAPSRCPLCLFNVFRLCSCHSSANSTAFRISSDTAFNVALCSFSSFFCCTSNCRYWALYFSMAFSMLSGSLREEILVLSRSSSFFFALISLSS